MADLVTAARSSPGFMQWLATGVWQKSFDQGSIRRGRDEIPADSIKITGVDHEPGEFITCSAKITDSARHPYRTLVEFFKVGKKWLVNSECSCPVELFCKHGVALIMTATEQADAPKGGTPTNPARDQPLDYDLAHWVDGFGKSAPPVKPTKPKPPEKRFLAYCILKSSYAFGANPWRFCLRIGNTGRDGHAIITATTSKADLARPPKYLVSEDYAPVVLFQQIRKKQYSWDELTIEGEGWEELFAAAMATSRFFFLQEKDGGSLKISAGPDLQALPGWDILPDGSAKPVVTFADGTPRVIFPTHPPRYLDAATGALGLITSDLPAHALASWCSGPAVPAKALLQVAERLQRVAPAMPAPVQAEEIKHPPAPPRPHLLFRKDLFKTGWASSSVILHARLRFRYGSGPLLPPLQTGETPVHVELRDGKRHVYPRDSTAEKAASKQLEKLGLTSLAKELPDFVKESAAAGAWVLLDGDFDDLSGWFDLLDSPGMANLRADGWTIDVAPDTGLLVHDAGDFFPEIESETNHGIEWFRFDAKFEIDGKTISLIPIIAEAISRDLPPVDSPDFPEFFLYPCEDPADGFIRFPARRLMEFVEQVRHLFAGHTGNGPVKIDRLGAAGLAASLGIDSSETLRALAALSRRLADIRSLPAVPVPKTLTATLRDYQAEGYHWLQFLAENSLHGILADDMGLGKTVQTLAHLAAESEKKPGCPSLVIAPTSVVGNWAAEAEKFTPTLKVHLHHGTDRAALIGAIPTADIVITSYPLLTKDFQSLSKTDWHAIVLDEAQFIKNSRAVVAQNVCQLRAAHRICLSGTPMENHLGELWSLMRFLMPGFLLDEKTFNFIFRKPIERDKSRDAQIALNRRVSPLILRRTKDQVATELPEKTEIIHNVELTKKQTDLYESVRAAMDKRVRDAIAAKGLAMSHIIVLDALLKLRQICCHPQLLKTPAAENDADSAKLDFLTTELLPTLLEEGRRILLFSSFTSMLGLIQAHLEKKNIPYLILTGKTTDRAALVKKFQSGAVPIFLISLKAGGTGLNLTAADTVIHYDPWWNPAAENQATDRAHRIGQTKPVFVHKLVCAGSIEERILDLQKHKSALVEALLSEETSKLKIDTETLSHLLAPITT